MKFKYLSFLSIVFLIGCQQSQEDSHTQEHITFVTAPRISYTGGASDANYLSGVVHIKNGCLYFLMPDGKLIHPIFATKSALMQDKILYVDSISYNIGDKVEFGGGEPHKTSMAESRYEWIVKPEKKCMGEYTLVINQLLKG